MNAGDPVIYRQVRPGGYGFASDVPAIFVRATPQRVVIRVRLKTGGMKQIAVAAANVRPAVKEESA